MERKGNRFKQYVESKGCVNRLLTARMGSVYPQVEIHRSGCDNWFIQVKRTGWRRLKQQVGSNRLVQLVDNTRCNRLRQQVETSGSNNRLHQDEGTGWYNRIKQQVATG